MNKFEQATCNDHQMSLAGGRPYHVTYAMMHVMLPIPYLPLQAVIMIIKVRLHVTCPLFTFLFSIVRLVTV